MPRSLIALIAEVMNVDAGAIDDGSDFETLGTWDSVREVELAFMLEHEYGIALTDDEMTKLHSVKEIRALLASRNVIAT